MAQRRSLHKKVSVNTELDSVSDQAALFYTWSIPHLDDFGRITGNIKKLTAEVMPLRRGKPGWDYADIENYLTELENTKDEAGRKLIVRYMADGVSVIWFPGFENLQEGLHKRTKSVYPEIPMEVVNEYSNNFPEISGKVSEVPASRARAETKRNEVETKRNEINICAPGGASAQQENQCESSESLTVETACGSGNKKPVAHSTTLTAIQEPGDQAVNDSLADGVEADKVTAQQGRKPVGNPGEQRPSAPFKNRKQEEMFDAFWREYPKRRARGNAEKAWVKISPGEQLFEAIMNGLKRAKTSADWAKDEGKYIPHPATWLNGKRWEDEITESQPNKDKRGDLNEQPDPDRAVANMPDWERKFFGIGIGSKAFDDS